MTKWTKKHYAIMAVTLSNIRANKEMVEGICHYFIKDNERFDSDLFKETIKNVGR